jgi:3-phenylpropionate/trans-cinnamate dioxygenase ferredoxin reductase subunit
MPEEIVVVVGGGQAAGQVVASLRQEGFIGRIVLIGREPVPPYQRPPLSKAYLAGEVPQERLLLKSRDFYVQSEVELRLGISVSRIRLADRALELDDGSSLAFDHLVFATGSRPRTLDMEGADHPRLFYLRTLADVHALRPHMAPGMRLLLIGGGYIGLEIAAVSRRIGLQVRVLEAAPHLLARVTGPLVGGFYHELHRGHGVDVRCGATVTRLEDEDGRPVVVTDDDERVAADFMVAGVGVIPNLELARDAGLVCNHGIVVDEHCRTSVPGIYAAGDCTEQPSSIYHAQIRLESVPNAIEQGRTVAATICGKSRPNRAVPWFWSDQYDVKLQSAGLQRGSDQAVMRGEPSQRSFAVYYLRAGRLLAIDAINRPAEFALAKAWIADRMVIAPERLADDAIPIKQIAS